MSDNNEETDYKDFLRKELTKTETDNKDVEARISLLEQAKQLQTEIAELKTQAATFAPAPVEEKKEDRSKEWIEVSTDYISEAKKSELLLSRPKKESDDSDDFIIRA